MTWAAAWRIARRDLSARFRGLRLLLVCLFLGTGALAAIGTLTGTIEQQLEERGREFLGGDLQVSLWQRALTAQELELGLCSIALPVRTADGRPYRAFPLPWAQPVIDEGRRLAASYANYLIVNGAVLMPAYGDPADDLARDVLAQAHPGREIVQVPCRSLIWQNGSLHCITMQLPEGLLKA